jgi:lysozyme
MPVDPFQSLIDTLKVEEGRTVNGSGRHILYKCPADKWTLGYGRNVEDRGISEVEAEFFLVNDIIQAQRDAASIIPSWLKINDARRNALTDMCFNLGLTKFSQFKNMLAAIARNDWPTAKVAARDSLWHNQVGQRAERIEQVLLTGEE